MINVTNGNDNIETRDKSDSSVSEAFAMDKLALWRSSILDAIGVRILPATTKDMGAEVDDRVNTLTVGQDDSVVESVKPVAGANTKLPAPAGLLPSAAPTPLLAPRLHKRRPYRYAAVFAFTLLVMYSTFYMLRLDRRFPELAWWMPWPVLYLDGDFVSWRELQDVMANRRQYSAMVGPNDLQLAGERQVIDAWLEARTIDLAIARYGVPFRSEVVEREYRRFEQGFGTAAELDEFLRQSYQMGVSEFRTQVLTPLLKRTLLEQYLGREAAAAAAALRRATALRQQLLIGELSFFEAARTMSDDAQSAGLGGDLGWFELSSARPEFARVLAKLRSGEVSEPVQTELGYHLLKLEAVVDGQAIGETETLHVSHILLKPVAIEQWLAVAVSRQRIVRLLPQ